ncbi:MAG: hypothetical protein M5U08_18775 [Burkholderiales bacterium]|nr:hypothetical protein [Burkholderiales bacterium]
MTLAQHCAHRERGVAGELVVLRDAVVEEVLDLARRVEPREDGELAGG